MQLSPPLPKTPVTPMRRSPVRSGKVVAARTTPTTAAWSTYSYRAPVKHRLPGARGDQSQAPGCAIGQLRKAPSVRGDPGRGFTRVRPAAWTPLRSHDPIAPEPRAHPLPCISCKGRYFCPSCHAKWLAIWIVWLEEALLEVAAAPPGGAHDPQPPPSPAAMVAGSYAITGTSQDLPTAGAHLQGLPTSAREARTPMSPCQEQRHVQEARLDRLSLGRGVAGSAQRTRWRRRGAHGHA
jgi:hypothetical protein